MSNSNDIQALFNSLVLMVSNKPVSVAICSLHWSCHSESFAALTQPCDSERKKTKKLSPHSYLFQYFRINYRALIKFINRLILWLENFTCVVSRADDSCDAAATVLLLPSISSYALKLDSHNSLQRLNT